MELLPSRQQLTEANKMKTTIEEINGVKHTVIWHIEPFPFLFFDNNMWNFVGYVGKDKIGSFSSYDANGDIQWVSLPPLPQNPTADGAKLLYEYAAHGLKVFLEMRLVCTIEKGIFIGINNNDIMCQKENGSYCDYYYFRGAKVLYAINEQGERVEVAICDRETEQ